MNANQTNCISCGMPMRSAAEHAMSDEAKNYCFHCARPDGSMKSYDEVVAGMAGFLKQTQGMDEKVAREAAKGMLSKMPAWCGR
ncbi:MAG: AraC family transcriptional regulator [Deltaproteobacteria bacterium]|nr:AraC family transcriptional regulator [Deltaproteobacteria bacterium]